jgi:hypothetical protein
MKDRNDELLDRLFMTVRSNKPDTAPVEDHFETRLLARIEEERAGEALWPLWAWRLIPWFATIVVLVGIGSVLYDPLRSGDLFAQFTNGYEEYLTTSLLAGG